MNRTKFPIARLTRRQFLIGQAVLLPWLVLGWKQNTPLTSTKTLHLTRKVYSADLRHLYSPSEAGHLYARSAPVAGLEETLERLARHHPHLAGWLAENRALIETAIQSPQIVYRQLPYRSSVGHYLQMYAMSHPFQHNRYVVVTLSLANLPGEMGSAYHKLVRVFPARFDYFWTRNGDGVWQLKQKWMQVV
jgi:hypothetical protein